MSDERLGEDAEEIALHHDEIADRLFEYRRRLEEETSESDVVDLTEAEETPIRIPEASEAPIAETQIPDADLVARVALLEEALRGLAEELRDLRAKSQRAAVLVDDRLAEIQEALGRMLGETPADS
jgi:hypothetical protein